MHPDDRSGNLPTTSTPRVDDYLRGRPGVAFSGLANLARQLERELAEAKSARPEGRLIGKYETGEIVYSTEWISVEERLPEARYGEEGATPVVSDDVWCVFPDGLHLQCNYDHERKEWCDVAALKFVNDGYDPTHWRPLPPPPQSGGKPK